jgi:hypothetical protein
MNEEDEPTQEEEWFWQALESLGFDTGPQIQALVRLHLAESGLSLAELAGEFLGLGEDEMRILSEVRAQRKRHGFTVISDDS